MSAPAPPPSHFVSQPPFAPIGFWPENPNDNEQSSPPGSRPDFPPFKKPRNSEDSSSIAVSNHNKNLRMPPPCRGNGKLFYKTRPCERFKDGTCPYGPNCNFAHGIEDLRRPPPNWQEIVGPQVDDRSSKWEEDLKIITRHKLCKNFYNGRVCPYGERCNYLHEDPGKFREESGKFRESSVINISTAGTSLDNGARSDHSDAINTAHSNVDSNWVNSKPVSWKTRMCNKWETSGSCPFGEKCHFAHGVAELKKFGGHIESEIGNAGTPPPKPLPKSANDVSLTNAVAGPSSKKQVLNKFLLKWKGPEKISRIYADWIDDIPSSKLEN
ncbi:hypothetical protein AQUCO_00100803v1 [Aquilegia coerulea]|uniref:C3H1-type domain-containing protein n=1 Tax=Aquilegia coerulea TaxID=218851 RepID=A0A2G5FC70_AQUCA|nr:hypothetical protein AQUCO_00100803v1 [Aquilegia coerulea]